MGSEPTAHRSSTTSVFDVLSSRRRREVVKVLSDDGEQDIGNLATMVAAIENDKHPQKVTCDERKRVYVGIYQTHAEKLDDAGLVEYNSREGTLSPTPLTDDVAAYIREGESTFYGTDGELEVGGDGGLLSGLLDRLR